jgi:hypothetical protein
VGARKDLALRSIRSKFAEWRRAKWHGDPIPAALWDEVHALERRVGRTRLALDLGLNASELAFQMELRGRAAAGAAQTPHTPAQAPTSVATASVSITKVVSVPLRPEPRGGAVVEVQAPSGWILRLQAEASPEFLRTFIEAASRAGGGA